MKTALLMVAWTIGALVALGLLAWLAGSALPAEHVSEAKRLLPAPAERVAHLIRDVEAQPRWRTGVTGIEVLQRGEGSWRYRESGKNGVITFAVSELDPGKRFESRIDDETLPFGGRWIITLHPEGGATRLRIREEGIVRPPLFRFLSRFVFGHGTTIRSYLDDAARAAEGR